MLKLLKNALILFSKSYINIILMNLEVIERLVAYLIIKIFMRISNKKKEFIHNLFFFTIFFKAFHIDLNIDD